jgi:Ca2+-binding EF-hand superfamily protein
MLSKETIKSFSDYFFKAIEGEERVEAERRGLCLVDTFDPHSAFTSIDKGLKGFLNSEDFRHLLSNSGCFCTEQEISEAIKQYDSNLDGVLSVSEFYQLVLPSTNSDLSRRAMARRGSFSLNAEIRLVNLLRAEIEYQRRMERMRQSLQNRKDFSAIGGFRLLDTTRKGFVDRCDIAKFLEKYRKVTEDEVDAVLRRMDNDGDGLISQREMAEEVMPRISEFKASRSVAPKRSHILNSERKIIQDDNQRRNGHVEKFGFEQKLYTSDTYETVR